MRRGKNNFKKYHQLTKMMPAAELKSAKANKRVTKAKMKGADEIKAVNQIGYL